MYGLNELIESLEKLRAEMRAQHGEDFNPKVFVSDGRSGVKDELSMSAWAYTVTGRETAGEIIDVPEGTVVAMCSVG